MQALKKTYDTLLITAKESPNSHKPEAFPTALLRPSVRQRAEDVTNLGLKSDCWAYGMPSMVHCLDLHGPPGFLQLPIVLIPRCP